MDEFFKRVADAEKSSATLERFALCSIIGLILGAIITGLCYLLTR